MGRRTSTWNFCADIPTTLLDANVILNVWDRDPDWYAWSRDQMRKTSFTDDLAINPILYAEISTRFAASADLDDKLEDLDVTVEPIPREAAFLAGKAFAQYRHQRGTKSNVPPDFFLGAHATVLGCRLLTRDARRYAAYFPAVSLIAPPQIC
ncbi:MAG: type II toxin-antitoxin system VapC family toxin [Terracidiphilus sp.]|jgi:predicted nucleic acid-binding protein